MDNIQQMPQDALHGWNIQWDKNGSKDRAFWHTRETNRWFRKNRANSDSLCAICEIGCQPSKCSAAHTKASSWKPWKKCWMVNGIKSSAEILEYKWSWLTAISGAKNIINNLKECGFCVVVRPIGGLKVVEVWRGSDIWVKSRQEKASDDLRNIVQIGNLPQWRSQETEIGGKFILPSCPSSPTVFNRRWASLVGSVAEPPTILVHF